MDSLSIVVALLLLVVVGALVVWRRRRGPATTAEDRLDTIIAWPPVPRRVLTQSERDAYLILRRALPDHLILAQVPLSRFIKVPTRNSYVQWLRRLGDQCVDLIVCDDATQVIAVIEIQPPTHELGERGRKRLARIARTLEAARIPLHLWAERAMPSPQAARDAVLPPKAVAAPAPATGRGDRAPATSASNPFDDSQRDSSSDEIIEAPPSTWFDELDSSPTPLEPDKKPRR